MVRGKVNNVSFGIQLGASQASPTVIYHASMLNTSDVSGG
jgi:hypothetical protein